MILRKTPLLLSAAAMLAVSGLIGCQSDDGDRSTRSGSDPSDTYYDRSRTAGEQTDRDASSSTPRTGEDVPGSRRIDGRSTDGDLRTPDRTPPVDDAAGAGTGGANEPAVTPPQPGTSGTRAPTQSANPDPHANTPADATDAKPADR